MNQKKLKTITLFLQLKSINNIYIYYINITKIKMTSFILFFKVNNYFFSKFYTSTLQNGVINFNNGKLIK